jgi:hypothetical protein
MRVSVLALVVGLCACGAALAEPPPDDREEGWRFQITPYAWLPSLGAEIEPAHGLPTFDASLSRSDILSDLDAAFFLNATARRGRFVLLGDVSWSSVSQDDEVASRFVPVPISVRGEVDQASLTLAAGWSVVARGALTLDLLAGVRGWRVEASLEAEAQLAPGFARGAETSVTRTWVDPILAVRTRVQPFERWSLIGYGDVGGFGAGSESTWQLVGTLNYQITDHFYVSAGWRHLVVDYAESGSDIDVALTGPLVGATFRFTGLDVVRWSGASR